MTSIVNFFAGPACGKSTAAAGLFHEMKKLDYSVEFVTEYAKDVVFEGTTILLENQVHIFSEQFRRQFKLLGKVDYIITDSPIALSCVYFDEYNGKSKRYNLEYSDLSKKYFLETFKQFDNHNFVIQRDMTKYSTEGRVESLDDSIALDIKILNFLHNNNLPYHMVDQSNAVSVVLEQIRKGTF